MREFSGKTAVITGGASGIGHGVAKRLAVEGMNLVIADIEQSALDSAVAGLEADGVSVLGVRTDVADNDSVKALAAAANEHFGDVHVLFNNAGVAGGGPILEPDDIGVWDWVLGVDLMGVIYGIKAFGPAMVAHQEPCAIVNTASMAGLLPTPSMGAYTVAKYGVVAMSEVLSLETRETTNLRVSVLCPGFVHTRIADSDRNIPEHLVSLEEPTEESEFRRSAVRDLLASGMPPSEVAQRVFEAIVEERFYILPHPQYGEQIVARAQHIAAGGSASTWAI